MNPNLDIILQLPAFNAGLQGWLLLAVCFGLALMGHYRRGRGGRGGGGSGR